MAYAGYRLNHVPGLAEVAGFLALVLVGVLIHASLITMLACISFWTVRAQGIIWGYYNLFNIARLPADAFSGWFKVAFTFVIPMLLISNVPVKVLIEKTTVPTEWVTLVSVGCAIFLCSELLWRYAVTKYTSASS